jgi:hypothetical protein
MQQQQQLQQQQQKDELLELSNVVYNQQRGLLCLNSRRLRWTPAAPSGVRGAPAAFFLWR